MFPFDDNIMNSLIEYLNLLLQRVFFAPNERQLCNVVNVLQYTQCICYLYDYEFIMNTNKMAKFVGQQLFISSLMF